MRFTVLLLLLLQGSCSFEELSEDTDLINITEDPSQISIHQFSLLNGTWPKAQQIPFCLKKTEHLVMLEIIEIAFLAWQQYVPMDKLNLTFSGYCKEQTQNVIFLQKPSDQAVVGVTTRTLQNGKISNVQIEIDARLTPSAGLFYNILLHELGHVIGCGHPTLAQDEKRMTVMSYSTISIEDRLLQNNFYITIAPGDIQCIQQLFSLQNLEIYSIVPSYPAWKHISGIWDIPVPVSVNIEDASIVQSSTLLFLQACLLQPTSRPSTSRPSTRQPSTSQPSTSQPSRKSFLQKEKSKIKIISNVSPIIDTDDTTTISSDVSPIIKTSGDIRIHSVVSPKILG
jgi:hypothetical protein